MSRVIRDPFTYHLPHLDIHGETAATCVALINESISDNYKLKNKKIIIVHGKGQGILKKQTHLLLKKDKRISKYYIDGLNDGETIIELNI